jgi:hypothetical protein
VSNGVNNNDNMMLMRAQGACSDASSASNMMRDLMEMLSPQAIMQGLGQLLQMIMALSGG